MGKKRLSEMTREELWQLFPICLAAYPDVAREYERMKRMLWRQFEHDRDGYTAQKTEFVREYTRRAKREWPGRY